MKDYQVHLEKLRTEATKCALIRDLATDKRKREVFDRLAGHLRLLADQVEVAMLQQGRRVEPRVPKLSGLKDAQRIVVEYAADLRETIRKLRRKMN